MNGIEFYDLLRTTYIQNGQPLYGSFTFCDWLYKKDSNSFSFRFNIPNNTPKSIKREIIITALGANQVIDDIWLEANFGVTYHKDCRLRMLNFLIKEHRYLR